MCLDPDKALSMSAETMGFKTLGGFEVRLLFQPLPHAASFPLSCTQTLSGHNVPLHYTLPATRHDPLGPMDHSDGHASGG